MNKETDRLICIGGEYAFALAKPVPPGDNDDISIEWGGKAHISIDGRILYGTVGWGEPFRDLQAAGYIEHADALEDIVSREWRETMRKIDDFCDQAIRALYPDG